MWTSALLCWGTADWESSLWRQAEGKPGRSLFVISLTLSWAEAEEAGALPFAQSLPQHTCAVRSLHSAGQYSCQWGLHGNMELHGSTWFMLKFGKENGSCTGSSFHLCFCFPQRYQDTWRSDIIHRLGKTHPDTADTAEFPSMIPSNLDVH